MILNELNAALAKANQLSSQLVQNQYVSPSFNDLMKIEREINRACNALSKFPIAANRTPNDLPAFGLYSIENLGFVIFTPRLPRYKGKYFQSYCTVGPMIEQFLAGADIKLNTYLGFSISMIQVYPIETPPNRMLDPDNIALKKLIDCICIATGVDDGGCRMKLEMMNIVTDAIPEGMYTLIKERNPHEDTIKFQQILKDIVYEFEAN